MAGPTHSRRPVPSRLWVSRKTFIGTASVGLSAILVLGLYLGTHDHTSDTSQTLGNLTLAAFALAGTVACVAAARRRNAFRRGWTLLAVAAVLWTIGQLTYTVQGLTRDNVYPFPSLADVWFLSYAAPTVAALVVLARHPNRLTSRSHTVLDVIVITVATLVISWGVVLERELETGSLGSVATVVGLLYPLVDVTICSMVLTLGMRQPPGERLYWVVLSVGLLALAVTDTSYVRLLSEGRTGLSGSPLALGWLLAYLLVMLATMVRAQPQDPTPPPRVVIVLLDLVPYLPVLASTVVFAARPVLPNSFLMWSGAVLLVSILLRQILIVVENTRVQELEVTLAAERASLASIVTSSNDAIVSISLQSRVMSWNPAAEHLFGVRAEDAIGRRPDLASAQEMAGLGDMLRDAADGRQLGSFNTDWRRGDGTTVPVVMTISPIVVGGVVTGISIIGQDNSERLTAEAALQGARAEALEASRMKSEFLATMSHEIRTPMNGVVGLTSLLLLTQLDDVQRQYALGVQGAGEALLGVINDILDFSKLEAGKVDLEVTDFDPRRLVEEVGSLLAQEANLKGLELIAYCRPDVPTGLRGDPGRIRQVLLNLASNAVKFTATGEVQITMSLSEGTADGVVTTRFEVSDTGIGVAAADQDRLFDSFSQADASTTRRYGGTGLGLAICRRLVEAMEGVIGVQSTVDQGSTFWFELPLALGGTGDQTPSDEQQLPHDTRVLVVDDNAANRAILSSQLRAWQLEPDLVDDAASALTLMREQAGSGRPYAIAVLDMCMPGTDGLQLAQSISADVALRDTRLIMLTSTMLIDADALRRAGVRQWLTKPVRSSELWDRLRQLMGQTTAPQAPTASGAVGDWSVGPRVEPSLGRVLVAEDNALNQLVTEGVVTLIGYQVDIVANGAEAVEAMAGATYDAVLMDCHMPVQDGYAATREIRRREGAGPRVPIIAMTASAMSGDRERALAAGMDDYVSKPVALQSLADLLSRWVPPGSRPADAVTATPVTSSAEHPSPNPEPTLDLQQLSSLEALGSLRAVNLVSTLLDLFARDSPLAAATIRASLDSRTAVDLEEAAHKLRGSAANLGLRRLAASCSRLEVAAGELRTLGTPELGRLSEDFDRELVSAMAALAEHASTHQQAEGLASAEPPGP